MKQELRSNTTVEVVVVMYDVRPIVVLYVYNMLHFRDIDPENVCSTYSDLQRPLNVVGNVIIIIRWHAHR